MSKNTPKKYVKDNGAKKDNLVIKFENIIKDLNKNLDKKKQIDFTKLNKLIQEDDEKYKVKELLKEKESGIFKRSGIFKNRTNKIAPVNESLIEEKKNNRKTKKITNSQNFETYIKNLQKKISDRVDAIPEKTLLKYQDELLGLK